MDFHEILLVGRYAGRNHLCKFWCGKIKGFGEYEGSNFLVFHWNGWSPLQQGWRYRAACDFIVESYRIVDYRVQVYGLVKRASIFTLTHTSR